MKIQKTFDAAQQNKQKNIQQTQYTPSRGTIVIKKIIIIIISTIIS